jgi:transcriptional regulator with XRE-family HTH domain
MNLSPSQLADQISVQRSSLSHILSGRNKPSLDFVTKVLASYPEISSDWLLFGKGTMIRKTRNEKPVEKKAEREIVQAGPQSPDDETDQQQQASKPKDGEPLAKLSEMDGGNDNPVEAIVIFYADSTFKSYKARK